MESILAPVAPVRPAAPYIGGKRNLAGRLVSRINSIPHQVYGEVFVGMGGVFFRRNHRPRTEIINDAAGDVANFFRILREHYGEFTRYLRFRPTCRADFDRLMRTDPATLTDLQRAARFLYLQRTAFGGKVAGRNFAMVTAGGGRFNGDRLEPMLEAIASRLAGVIVEQMDWRAFLQRYDQAGTLFYLDPPYYGSENDYGAGLFGRDQFERMAEALAQLKGKFLLSLNDRPQVREIFAAFRMVEEATTYTISDGPAQRAAELIITNT